MGDLHQAGEMRSVAALLFLCAAVAYAASDVEMLEQSPDDVLGDMSNIDSSMDENSNSRHGSGVFTSQAAKEGKRQFERDLKHVEQEEAGSAQDKRVRKREKYENHKQDHSMSSGGGGWGGHD